MAVSVSFSSPFSRGKMFLQVTPMTIQNFFIQALKSAVLLPSNFLSPRMVLTRLVPMSPVSVMLTSAVGADAVLVPWRPFML